MIYAECSVVDLKTNRIKGKYNKVFDSLNDFNSWFKIVKTDYDTIINVMQYDPEVFPGRKDYYDAKLLRVERINEN